MTKNRSEIDRKLTKNDQKNTQKWTKNDQKLTKTDQKLCRNCAEIVQKRPQKGKYYPRNL